MTVFTHNKNTLKHSQPYLCQITAHLHQQGSSLFFLRLVLKSRIFHDPGSSEVAVPSSFQIPFFIVVVALWCTEKNTYKLKLIHVFTYLDESIFIHQPIYRNSYLLIVSKLKFTTTWIYLQQYHRNVSLVEKQQKNIHI